jgi:dTDP-4-amino-4,6-dideoxygalactose transaminase
MLEIAFNQHHIAENEAEYVQHYLSSNRARAAYESDNICSKLLTQNLKTDRHHLTSSCTASLEISCLLAGIGPGDEVILPSHTFSSTANAIALRGAVPVFVDVKPSTLNIDETLIEQAITSKTKAIIAVHYAGIACNMNVITEIAERHQLFVIEDAAQAIGVDYFGAPLGTIGDFGAISFHHTKNIHCGEGGAFIARDPEMYRRAAYTIEKGANRLDFIEGRVSKYHWVSLGSSYVLSDLQKALLAAQLEDTESINTRRAQIWQEYQSQLEVLSAKGYFSRPTIEAGSSSNGHIYYILVEAPFSRLNVQSKLAQQGISSLTHYEPLHLSPAGQNYGRVAGSLAVTEDICQRLLRLPLWPDMTQKQIDHIIRALAVSFETI